jgi:hypothetical protein
MGAKGSYPKKMMWHIWFFLVNWSYFTIGLLYWGLILENLSFYGKKIWVLVKIKN